MNAGKIAYVVLKLAAMVVGLPLAIAVTMTACGAFVSNLWAQLGIALVALVGLPLFIADRLLPDDDPQAGRGIPTDVSAALWLTVAMLGVGPLNGLMADLFDAQARRWAACDFPRSAALAATLGHPAPESDVEEPAPEADAPADAPVVDAGPPVDVGPVDAGPPPTAADEDMTPAELFARWSPSVVTIASASKSGTGFVIDAIGTIATNEHVVNGAGRVGVKFVDGTWASKVDLLFLDSDLDLALLRVETTAPLRPVVLGDSDGIQVGEAVVSIGNPLGLEHTLTDGLVSSRRVFRGRPMIQMSTPVSPGNSGGPLFNLRGEVMGVTTMVVGTFAGGQNLNLAIPVNVLKEQLREEYPERRTIGGGPVTGTGTW